MGVIASLKKGLADGGYISPDASPTSPPVVIPTTATPNSMPIAPSATEGNIQSGLTTALENGRMASIYATFMAMLQVMQSLPDNARYVAALNAVKVANQINGIDVTNAINERISIVETEQKRVTMALESYSVSTSTSLTAQAQDVAARLDAKRVELRELERQQESIKSNLASLHHKLVAEKESVAIVFNTTKAELHRELLNLQPFVS